jgi:four helix bundle protein
MTPVELKARTKKFAVDVIRFAKSIPRDHINDEIASQLTDAATSTAAYYRASCRARSRADFINKLAGGIEEVDDTNDSIINDQQVNNRQVTCSESSASTLPSS